MLNKIQLINFKIHEDTTVNLSPFTLLVGPNGCGKTSVLQACFVLLEGIFKKTIFYGEKMALDKFTKTSSNVSPEIKAEGVYHEIKFDVLFNPSKHYNNHVTIHRMDEVSIKYNSSNSFDMPLIGEEAFPSFFKLIGQYLLQPSYCPDVTPKLSKNGANLASTVAYLMTYDHERFLELQENIQIIIPTVKKIRVRPAKVELEEEKEIQVNRKPFLIPETREVIGHELVFDTASGTAIPASAMSEGTLMTLGILTAVMHPDCPNTVLLDDIEQGLHPLAQKDLIQSLKRLQEIRPDLQLIATTHSPYIIDELPPSAICVMACDEAGKVYAQTLDQHPEASHALDVLTTGEFLSAEGESWVISHD